MSVREGDHGHQSVLADNQHLSPGLQRSRDRSEHAIGQAARTVSADAPPPAGRSSLKFAADTQPRPPRNRPQTPRGAPGARGGAEERGVAGGNRELVGFPTLASAQHLAISGDSAHRLAVQTSDSPSRPDFLHSLWFNGLSP
jgi:hypothetical protein